MSAHRRIRHYRIKRAAAALGCALALATCSVPQQALAAAASATPWPSAPDWQSYVETPASATVCPAAIVSTSGTVTGAPQLLHVAFRPAKESGTVKDRPQPAQVKPII